MKLSRVLFMTAIVFALSLLPWLPSSTAGICSETAPIPATPATALAIVHSRLTVVEIFKTCRPKHPLDIVATVTEGKNGNTVTGAATGLGYRALQTFSDSQAQHPWTITPGVSSASTSQKKQTVIS